MVESVEVQVECDCCEGTGGTVMHDPGIPGFARARDVRVSCGACRGVGRRWVAPVRRAPCALCGERPADATIAALFGSACCRACAADVERYLSNPPAANAEPGFRMASGDR